VRRAFWYSCGAGIPDFQAIFSVAWDSNELVLNFTLGVRKTEMLQDTLNFLEIPVKKIKLLACVVHMIRAGTVKG
jgi:hypothetical protein